MAEKNKVAIILLADTEAFGDWGRMANALTTAKEFKEAGDTVQIIFDGAGSKWVGELEKPDHKYHTLYKSVADRITGVCGYCAKAFKVDEAVKKADLPLLDEFDGHPSVRKLVNDGVTVLTF